MESPPEALRPPAGDPSNNNSEMKKFIIALAAVALGFGGASANDDIVRFKVNPTSGETQIFEIKKVDKITFENDEMVVKHLNGEERFDLDGIDFMDFDVISGIEDVYETETADALNISVRNGLLKASLPDSDITVRIFDFNGRAIDMVQGNSEVEYALYELPKGTYVILVNEKAIKFIR